MWLPLVCAALAACGADLAGNLTGAPITGYEASNVISPTGHSVAAYGDGRFRITATGSSTTPKARVEKIALARAAEYGVESGHKFFKTDAPRHSILCGKKQTSERGQTVNLPARGYAVVQVDVSYAKDAADPTYRATKETAEILKAEIAAEQPAPEAQAEIKAAVGAQCGF
ncbi:MAG: hypothetical protein ACT4OU_10985 [Hyphomicrobium sp.]